MSERAKRLSDTEPGDLPDAFDFGEITYWRQGKTWMLYLPGGGMGNLSSHNVEEHEDGTITVSPSILVTKGRDDSVRRHGFLKHGEWHPCGDDRPPTEGGEDG